MKPAFNKSSVVLAAWFASLGAAAFAGYAFAQAGAPKEPRGITIEDLGTLSVAGEFESLDGLKLSLRRLTIQPGGASRVAQPQGPPRNGPRHEGHVRLACRGQAG